jgi:hypothetical protein
VSTDIASAFDKTVAHISSLWEQVDNAVGLSFISSPHVAFIDARRGSKYAVYGKKDDLFIGISVQLKDIRVGVIALTRNCDGLRPQRGLGAFLSLSQILGGSQDRYVVPIFSFTRGTESTADP